MRRIDRPFQIVQLLLSRRIAIAADLENLQQLTLLEASSELAPLATLEDYVRSMTKD